MQRLVVSVMCGLVWDAIMVTWQRLASDTNTIPGRRAWDGPTVGRIAFAEVLMLGTVYCGMNMQYASASALAVGLLGGEVEVCFVNFLSNSFSFFAYLFWVRWGTGKL
jgi:hypothetical protein